MNGYRSLLISNIAAVAFNTIFVFYLLNAVSVTMFASILLSQSFAALAVQVAGTQSANAFVVFINESKSITIKNYLLTIIVELFFAGVVVFVGVAVVYWLSVGKYNFPVEMSALYIFLSLPFFSINGPALAILRVNSEFSKIAVAKIIGPAIRLVGLFLIDFFGVIEQKNVAIFWCLSELISTIYLWISSRFLAKNIITYKKINNNLLKYFKNIIKSWFVGILDIPVQHADKIIIGTILDASIFSSYIIIRRLTSSVLMLVDPFYQILLPVYSEIISKNNFFEIKNISIAYAVKGFLLTFFPGLVIFFSAYMLDNYMFNGVLHGQQILLLVFLTSAVTMGALAFSHPLAYALQIHQWILIVTGVTNTILLFWIYVSCTFQSVLMIAIGFIGQAVFAGMAKIIFSAKIIQNKYY